MSLLLELVIFVANDGPNSIKTGLILAVIIPMEHLKLPCLVASDHSQQV